MTRMRHSVLLHLMAGALLICLLPSCGGGKKAGNVVADTLALSQAPVFCQDSAMAYIEAQCCFGPRTPGSTAHRACGDWIAGRFAQLGLEVTEQQAEVTAWDGKRLPMRNIIASANPEAKDRILLCAHWDSRPWADNDPDPGNHDKPVLAANDGASGVAVMMEIARLAAMNPLDGLGLDFICFDIEDYGTHDDSDSWCLGSAYWAEHKHKADYTARYGILFDMVGGRGSHFAQEGYSLHYCRPVVSMLWQIARQLGYSSIFLPKEGGYATDDHVPLNQVAGIPTLDIIPHFDAGPSSFGPTWHTVNDTPENIDPAILKAVGQSVVQLIWND